LDEGGREKKGVNSERKRLLVRDFKQERGESTKERK